ncbi:hypothetical protein [Leptospira noguchii]|uniref:hypothetical protein n=1 Tax=Leptospira noguchii TaxID=28182 RepID=UPI0018DED448|nr:hypothetical protein [Leptospira noguchii]UOG50086.1 hypothetical protein MAL00_07630 [Leptospira noguchii]
MCSAFRNFNRSGSIFTQVGKNQFTGHLKRILNRPYRIGTQSGINFFKSIVSI